MIISENMHTSNTIETEQGTCVFQTTHVYSHTYIHVTTINVEKRQAIWKRIRSMWEFWMKKKDVGDNLLYKPSKLGQNMGPSPICLSFSQAAGEFPAAPTPLTQTVTVQSRWKTVTKTQTATARIWPRHKDTDNSNWKNRWIGTNAKIHPTT